MAYIVVLNDFKILSTKKSIYLQYLNSLWEGFIWKSEVYDYNQWRTSWRFVEHYSACTCLITGFYYSYSHLQRQGMWRAMKGVLHFIEKQGPGKNMIPSQEIKPQTWDEVFDS